MLRPRPSAAPRAAAFAQLLPVLGIVVSLSCSKLVPVWVCPPYSPFQRSHMCKSACPGQALWSCAGDATANSRAQRHRSACLGGAGGPTSATSFTSAPTSGLVLVLSDDDDEDALDSDDRQPVSSLRTNGPYGPGLPTGQPAAHAGGGDGRCSVACIVRPPHRQLPAGATLALRLAAQSSSPWLCIIEPRRSTVWCGIACSCSCKSLGADRQCQCQSCRSA